MQVYVDQLSVSDMEYIAETIFPAIGKNIISKMVHFNHKVKYYFYFNDSCLNEFLSWILIVIQTTFC